MERLFNFIYSYRAFFTFLILELFCAWLIIENNQYQSTKYFNSSNALAASINHTSQNIREYFSLRDINSDLANENVALRKQLDQREQLINRLDSVKAKDSTKFQCYDYISAKVVNNTTRYYKNFMTVNKGKDFGLQPGMAAISSQGVAGKVKSVSDHYSVLISVLNIDEQISSVIRRTGHFGTIQWDGIDPRMTNLKYIPRHVRPLIGDTVVTSGFNSVFPENIMIGIIRKINLKDEALFYDLRVELVQDLGKIAYVEIIKSLGKKEQDSLEHKTIGDPK